MKRIALVFCMAALAGCAKRAPEPSGSSISKKDNRSLEERMRSVDTFLAKQGVPGSQEKTVPVLEARAKNEVLTRFPRAKVTEIKMRFVRDLLVIATISYTVGGDQKPREQEIQFIWDDREWALFWIPTSQKKQG
jgi:hypothetical protein